MNRNVYKLLPAGLALFAVVLAAPALAQGNDPNECDSPGEAPDVIVGALQSVGNYGASGDYYGYSVGTTSCNIGTCWLNWFSGTNEHPVIGQNMYRIKDGRLDQIGQSWLKHGFFALSQTLCSDDCESTDGTHLGVNCSDPYTSGLNGSQGNLGPRYEVNPSTGIFPFPFTGIGETGDAVFRRIKVHKDDLDPALNAGAQYFVEGQYITADDAAADRDDNNASWRPINVNATTYDISVSETTRRQEEAIFAWKEYQPTVSAANVKIPNDGDVYVGADTWIEPSGDRRYVYAIHNYNSDRAIRRFEVPIPPGAVVSNLYFNDTDSHSGEPYDTADWVPYIDYPNSKLVWETPETFDENPNANAIRWGTTYTFGFDIDQTDVVDASVPLGIFKPEVIPGDGTFIDTKPIPTPDVCDFDGICERGETCSNCPDDCQTLSSSGFCGDNICDTGANEDCLNCPSDCNGLQSGPVFDQFCCARGGGTNPAFCIDPRCNDNGNTCMDLSGTPSCCGDGICDSGESVCQCERDCGPAPLAEGTCNDGEDNDCDGNVDCADSDCCTDSACTTGQDSDNDGVTDCDCNDGNPNVWGRPSATGTLTIDDTAGATLAWSAPVDPGATSVQYETLRTELVDVLEFTSTCMADANPSDLVNTDGQSPSAGGVFFYLIRATNSCPGDQALGSLGQDTDGDRVAPACP